MGLFRLLFWIALIAAAFWFWRRFTRKRQPAAPREARAANMVRCAHCGVHVIESEALPSEQRWYCSRLHLEQGPRRP